VLSLSERGGEGGRLRKKATKRGKGASDANRERTVISQSGTTSSEDDVIVESLKGHDGSASGESEQAAKNIP